MGARDAGARLRPRARGPAPAGPRELLPGGDALGSVSRHVHEAAHLRLRALPLPPGGVRRRRPPPDPPLRSPVHAAVARCGDRERRSHQPVGLGPAHARRLPRSSRAAPDARAELGSGRDRRHQRRAARRSAGPGALRGHAGARPAPHARVGDAPPGERRSRHPLRLRGAALPPGRVPGRLDRGRPALQLHAHRSPAQLRRALDDRKEALGESGQPGPHRQPGALVDDVGDAAAAPAGGRVPSSSAAGS